MFPLVLDLTVLPIFIIGAQAARERLPVLREYGATQLHVFISNPAPDTADLAGARLQRREPSAEDFARLRPRLIFMAGAEAQKSAYWRSLAHDVGALVHVQDDVAQCDFHVPAVLRRGRLQVAVSTDGVAPGLARILRDYLSQRVFGAEWADRLEEIGAVRGAWKKAGQGTEKLREAITALIRERGWL
jgi:precorrin-2 dehydrogenase/sirohydrochlorin ferrochelatase